MVHTPRLSTARAELARRLEHWLEFPMAVLGVIWLVLLVVEFVYGATPGFDTLTTTIWITFSLEFAARFLLAPHKLRYLRRHWITAVSLAIPAVRIFRVTRLLRLARAGRTLRAMRMARLLTSFSRGMRSLGMTMRSRGFPYVATLTVIVLLLGAAGMYAFERDVHPAFSSYGTALWWTAMLLTTMGSEHWPQSPEGRLVCLLLSVYAFAVFGYITATLASFFIGGDAASQRALTSRLDSELATLRGEMSRVSARSDAQP
jgi:voltage-gated potassium channel